MAIKTMKKRKCASTRRWVEKQEASASNYLAVPNGVSLFAHDKEGEYQLDIIPYMVSSDNIEVDEGDDMAPFFTFYLHPRMGPDNVSIVCPLKTFHKPCPICEYREELKRDKDKTKEEAFEAGKPFWPKRRMLWNVIDRTAKDKGIQVWETAYSMSFGEMLYDKVRLGKGKYDDYHDMSGGLTVEIDVKEADYEGNKFMKVCGLQFKERKPLEDSLIDKATCLDSVPRLLSYDTIKKLVFSGVVEPDDDGPPPPSKNGDTKPKAESKDKEEEHATPEFAVGDKVFHKKFGECEVLKIVNGRLRLKDEDDTVHRDVAPDECHLLEESEEESEDAGDEDDEKAPVDGEVEAPVGDDDDD